jgi:glycosyltransferase involved in cell wall biosynthesis
MKVIAIPKAGSSYTEAFYRAVEDSGLTVTAGVFSGGWLVQNVQRGDVVHLHWPSFLYSDRGSLFTQFRLFLRFLALLLLIRLRGGILMWTAHNVLPHDRSTLTWLDPAGRHAVIALSRAIFVHGSEAAKVFVERFPRSAAKIRLIPHGNWIGFYPDTTDQATARKALELADEAFAFLFIGLCKPYKNLDGLIAAFRRLEGDFALIVAGGFQDASYLARIRGMAAEDPRVRLFPGFIPDEQMHLYLRACDAVVAPYRDILTSGTAMLALSFGRPFISVRKGFLLEVVTDDCGLLFDAEDEDSMVAALRGAALRRFEPQAILARARDFTFEHAAAEFNSAVRDAAQGR